MPTGTAMPTTGSTIPSSTVTSTSPTMPSTTPSIDPTGMEPIEPPLALGECGLDTGFSGDEFCILPPDPAEGFQLHIGPTDYDDPDATYVLQPGEEATTDFPAISGNETDIFFYYRQYRMRPTAHHMIVTEGGFGGLLGRRIATANMSQDFPAGGVIAPENVGVGSPLAARSNLNVSLHAINATDAPQLREIWVNFWYRDPAEVTQPAEQIFKTGSTSFSIQPHTEAMLGPYTCNVTGEGRMLWIYGHRHANNVRFTASRVRGSQIDIVYEAYHWEEPLLLEYSSVTQNPVPNRELQVEGGWSGVLDLMPGDQIAWECHVINNNDTVLRFSNQTYLGEMCILDGETVGTTCSGF